MSALTDYIDAWKSNDTERIVATVTHDVVITESFGPIYHGRDSVREWCERWNHQGSRVLDWVVTASWTPRRRSSPFAPRGQ